jgi:hypothetical protein
VSTGCTWHAHPAVLPASAPPVCLPGARLLPRLVCPTALRPQTFTRSRCRQVIAAHLPVDEVQGLRNLFKEIDKNRSGSISVEEFVSALRKKGSAIPQPDMMRMMQASTRL